LISSARSRGYIRDRGGMYRYLPDLRSRDRKLSAEAERHVVSSRIQGTAQTAIQNSMRHLRPSIQALADSGHDIKWRLQVHDELILTCPREDVEIADYLCLDAMTNHHGLKLKIPIVAKGHTATTWGELK
jgi:DNA polymerase I-like protein with 3'-5' exonuclease and polymerase domains